MAELNNGKPVLLSVKGLKVAYGGIQAVKGATLEVREGELVTLIGANGAGKSSLLRARLDCQNKSGRNVPVSCGSTQMQSRTAPNPTAACRRARADLHLAAKSPDSERNHRRYAPHSAFNKIGRRPHQAGGVG